MMDEDGLRRDSLREGLKAKGVHAGGSGKACGSEKGSRPRRNENLPLASDRGLPR